MGRRELTAMRITFSVCQERKDEATNIYRNVKARSRQSRRASSTNLVRRILRLAQAAGCQDKISTSQWKCNS